MPLPLAAPRAIGPPIDARSRLWLGPNQGTVGRNKVGLGLDPRVGSWLAVRVMLGAVSCWCALGCATGDAGEASKSPPAQCQDYENSYCSAFAACALSTDRVDDRESCDFSFRVYFPCESVTFVAGNTQTCLDTLGSLSCTPGSAPATPAECKIFGTQ